MAVAGPSTATVTMAQRFKIDLFDEIPTDLSPDKIKSPYVSKTFWEHSGAIIRVYNCDVPGSPTEVGIIRLRASNIQYVPVVLARERQRIKNWALQHVHGSLKEACHNIGMDPRLTSEEWSMRYTVTTLSPYGRRMLGEGEPGLWVLHCPEYLEEAIFARYSDGSDDRAHHLNLYINLVKPEHRIRKVEGGWIKEEETDEKRPRAPPGRSYSRGYNRTFDNRFRGRPYMDDEEYFEKTAERVAAKLSKSSAPDTTDAAAFPNIPPSKNPGAVQAMVWPEGEIPFISCKL